MTMMQENVKLTDLTNLAINHVLFCYGLYLAI